MWCPERGCGFESHALRFTIFVVSPRSDDNDDTASSGHDWHPVTRLPTLGQLLEQTELLAHDIADELGDTRSLSFYFLVAGRVLESTIRQHLSEINHSDADNTAGLLNYRIRRYVDSRLTKTRAAELAERKERLFQ